MRSIVPPTVQSGPPTPPSPSLFAQGRLWAVTRCCQAFPCHSAPWGRQGLAVGQVAYCLVGEEKSLPPSHDLPGLPTLWYCRRESPAEEFLELAKPGRRRNPSKWVNSEVKETLKNRMALATLPLSHQIITTEMALEKLIDHALSLGLDTRQGPRADKWPHPGTEG